MKKVFGISLLSVLLTFGQPFIVLADGSETRTINFDDIEKIITEQNIAIRINENERLKTKAGYSELKSTIRELEDDIDDIKEKRDRTNDTTQIVALNTEKKVLVDALEQLERSQVDRPTLELIVDLQASKSDNNQIMTAESLFISYNELSLALSDISTGIDTLQDQLGALQLQASLGMVSYSAMNELETKLVDLQTKLESTKFQQDSIERQLKYMINDQENNLIIGSSIPSIDEEFTVEDEKADLAKALENSYTIKLQENQIVILQAALDRAKKDNRMSSNEYKVASYELANANLQLTQLKDSLKLNYNTMIESIVKMQSNLELAEQTLEDNKVALSEAQMKMDLGMISQLELDKAVSNYQIQENAVKTEQIELFNAILKYEWFLKGMPSA